MHHNKRQLNKKTKYACSWDLFRHLIVIIIILISVVFNLNYRKQNDEKRTAQWRKKKLLPSILTPCCVYILCVYVCLYRHVGYLNELFSLLIFVIVDGRWLERTTRSKPCTVLRWSSTGRQRIRKRKMTTKFNIQ